MDELNLLFWRWLEEDYHRKNHSSLGVSPLDFFMSQAHKVTLFSNPELLKDHFLMRKFVTELNPSLYRQCYFSLATVTLSEFYYGLAIELGEQPAHKKVAMFRQIQQAICSMYYDNRITPVIVLDEIHLASNKLLEDLRLIFNFKMDSQNPFILILSGQPPIRNKLGLNINKPLRQRLAVKHIMQGLKQEEIKDYCNSRLRLAGLVEDIITDSAFEVIYANSNGIPRVVNSLMTTSLIYACNQNQRRIDEEVIYHAQNELNI